MSITYLTGRVSTEDGEAGKDSQGIGCAFHEFRRKRVLEDAEQGLAVKQKQKQVAEDRKGSKSC